MGEWEVQNSVAVLTLLERVACGAWRYTAGGELISGRVWPVTENLCSQRRGPGSVPGQGTRSHLPQIRVGRPQLKILNAKTKTPTREINQY